MFTFLPIPAGAERVDRSRRRRAGVLLAPDQNTARVIAAGILALAGLALVMYGLARAQWLLDRRRPAAWRTTGPQWTTRR
jgi:hypothetical protein